MDVPEALLMAGGGPVQRSQLLYLLDRCVGLGWRQIGCRAGLWFSVVGVTKRKCVGLCGDRWLRAPLLLVLHAMEALLGP